ncbi:hypothetical protein AB0F18_20290 [Streptomyces sp. NPDC029216]|uniref:hypothetical protein n=1 Tax=Streptomyces sp. NPDC029216 TaxID=3154701 RepID=UPI003405FA49
MAPATWHYPAGTAHEQTIPVPAGSRRGDTVRAWVDDHGDAAPAPPTTSDIAVNTIGLDADALCGIALAADALLFVRLRILDAQRALVPYPVANPDEVEVLRAAWGFQPLETYIEHVAAGAGRTGPGGSQRARIGSAMSRRRAAASGSGRACPAAR